MPSVGHTPWDVYVDECKAPNERCLGFLLVPNTASFAQKLFRRRQDHHPEHGSYIETREVHWNNMHRGVGALAMRWIDLVFQHKGAKFYRIDWPKAASKETVVLDFITRLAERKKLVGPPFNVVVIMDYDSSHARARIQNTIRESGRIARCYHLDSSKNDCIQCCDLLLGAVRCLRNDPTAHLAFAELSERWERKEKLKNAEVKRLVAGFLATCIDTQSRSVYP